MGTFEVSGADGTYSILVDEAAPIKKMRIELDMSTRYFPIGAMGTFQGLCGTHIL